LLCRTAAKYSDAATVSAEKTVARRVAGDYDVLEDRGGAVGVSGGGTTVGVCVGVTTPAGVLVTLTVVLLLEPHPVIAAVARTAPQPITHIIFALLIFTFALLIFPPGVYHLCGLPPQNCSGRCSWWRKFFLSQLPGWMVPVSAVSIPWSLGRVPSSPARQGSSAVPARLGLYGSDHWKPAHLGARTGGTRPRSRAGSSHRGGLAEETDRRNQGSQGPAYQPLLLGRDRHPHHSPGCKQR
jgi:hypothetical protein